MFSCYGQQVGDEDKAGFLFGFCNFAARGFLYIVLPSVLSLIISKPIDKTKAAKKKFCIEETVIIL